LRPLVLEKSSKHQKKVPNLGRSNSYRRIYWKEIWTVDFPTSREQQEEHTGRGDCESSDLTQILVSCRI
jgi:hypothetical protein